MALSKGCSYQTCDGVMIVPDAWYPWIESSYDSVEPAKDWIDMDSSVRVYHERL